MKFLKSNGLIQMNNQLRAGANSIYERSKSSVLQRTSQPLPAAAMIHARPEEFVTVLTKKLEEAQRQMEFKETVNKKLESIEVSSPVCPQRSICV